MTDSIKELLAKKLVEEPKNVNLVISSLMVVAKFAGKKWLIFDLYYHINTKPTSDFRGKLMEKLDILFLHFCQSDLIQPHFYLERLFIL